MASYKHIQGGVFKYDKESYIPQDVNNKDWRRYLKYVSEGGQTDSQYTQEELDSRVALEARVSLLEQEREAANLRDITPQEAKDWIDAQFAAATTNAQVVQAIKKILKKMVVFILR